MRITYLVWLIIFVRKTLITFFQSHLLIVPSSPDHRFLYVCMPSWNIYGGPIDRFDFRSLPSVSTIRLV